MYSFNCVNYIENNPYNNYYMEDSIEIHKKHGGKWQTENKIKISPENLHHVYTPGGSVVS